MKVFLSHSNRDKALVREIRSHLPKHVNTWLDENELLIGADLKVSIRNAIQEEADFIVIFLSREAIQSEWVKQELHWALEREKNIGRTFVLPILLEDVWNHVEPKEFQDRLYLKCFDQSEIAVKAIADKLSEHIFAWLSQHLDESRRKELEHQRDAEESRKREIGSIVMLTMAPSESCDRMKQAYGRVFTKRVRDRDEIIQSLIDSSREEIEVIRQQANNPRESQSQYLNVVATRMERMLAEFSVRVSRDDKGDPYKIYLEIVEKWDEDVGEMANAFTGLIKAFSNTEKPGES